MFQNEFYELCEKAAAGVMPISTDHDAAEAQQVYTMLFRVIKLELVLKKASFGGIKNVLFCRVYPNKVTSVFYYLPEIFTELDIPEFRSCFYSMIENEERLKACFEALWGIILQYLDTIEEASSCGRLPWTRETEKDDYLERRLMFSEPGLFSREYAVILEYTTDSAYSALLTGDIQKAVKTLERRGKKGRNFEYQNRLCAFLKENPDFVPMPDECNALKEDVSAEKRSMPVILSCFAVSAAAFMALFLIASFIIKAFFARGCTAFLGPQWYQALIPALLPAVFGAIFFRRELYKLLFPKRAKNMIERDTLKNSALTDKIAKIALSAALGVAIAFLVMMHADSARVYEDRLDTLKSGAMFSREEYLFSDIERVCHISARHNYLGQRIERGSYVLIMKDGRLLNLDGYATERGTKEKLLPLLEGKPIEELDSDEDIENTNDNHQ